MNEPVVKCLLLNGLFEAVILECFVFFLSICPTWLSFMQFGMSCKTSFLYYPLYYPYKYGCM